LGRPKNVNESKKIEPVLPLEAYQRLEELVTKGYGSNPTDVGRYLILRELDDLKRSGVLPA
jgi:hypothetical protein